ncbi:SpnB-like Rossmann fold domain-containing protein [Nocardia vinacea]|uniref:SpnB-like Rossmann fold domain-containing protein n=1 Tax=Nocardia vinacea TaxID=96468 RepID=UPI0035713978
MRDDSQPSARDRVNAALQLVRGWLADERFARSRLVVVTRRAVALPDAAPDSASAAVSGLLCSAQTEYPERFRPRPRCRSRQATPTSGPPSQPPCDCHSGGTGSDCAGAASRQATLVRTAQSHRAGPFPSRQHSLR